MKKTYQQPTVNVIVIAPFCETISAASKGSFNWFAGKEHSFTETDQQDNEQASSYSVWED